MQRAEPLDRAVPILPDVAGVREEALRLFPRDTLLGLKSQLDRGDGTEFHALRGFPARHGPAPIDWKQSARHGELIAKEFRTERNQHIVVALDTGRLMSEPLLGQPRLDRALHAALLLAYVGLKLGDRVGLFAFDAKPAPVQRHGAGAARPSRCCSGWRRALDYSTEETNFTLGLTQLAGELERRSTDRGLHRFRRHHQRRADAGERRAGCCAPHRAVRGVPRRGTGSMLQRDEPRTADDVSRAVIADVLLRERDDGDASGCAGWAWRSSTRR